MGLTYILGIILLVAMAVLGVRRLLRERRAAADEIQALNDHLKNKALALQTANSELESFSYSVAHDLRTPLRAIGSYAHMLHEDFGTYLPDEAQRYIRVICDSATKMENLIADLLAFSGIGRAQMKIEPYHPRAAVMRACKEVLAHYPNVTPQIEVGELPEAKADGTLMYQVWLNLIDNAVKYSSKSSAPRVRIGGQVEEGRAVFFVRDNGAGFDMRYADKLFGVFERLHGQDEFPGTGVGLAIVERVVGRHGGRVWAQGETGKGATFYFSLPLE